MSAHLGLNGRRLYVGDISPVLVAIVSGLSGAMVALIGGVFGWRGKRADHQRDREKDSATISLEALRLIVETQADQIAGLTERLSRVEKELSEVHGRHRRLQEKYSAAVGYVVVLVTRLRLEIDPTERIFTPPSLIARDVAYKKEKRKEQE